MIFGYEKNVALFDSNEREVLEGIGMLKASCSPMIKYFTHPTAERVQVTDHSIELPNEIVISGKMDSRSYRDTMSELRSLAKNREKFTVQLKSGIYENMYIDSYPTEEDTDHYDTLSFILSFVEHIIADEVTDLLPPRKVKNKQDADTTERGEVSKAPVTETESINPLSLLENFNG